MDLNNLKIEKGVPIKAFRFSQNTELLKKMEIGDSIFFKEDNSSNIRNSFYSIAKRVGIKILVRRVEGGCRLWRVE